MCLVGSVWKDHTMEATSVGPLRRRTRSADKPSERYVLIQAKVPEWVHAHFREAAKAAGVSMSLYLEMLAKTRQQPGEEPPTKES